MDAKTILEQAVANGASDIFIVAGLPVSCRKNGVINRIYEDRLLPPDTESLLVEIYRLADNRDISQLHKHGDDDFSFAIQGVSRFRVSAYKQRGSTLRGHPRYHVHPAGSKRAWASRLYHPAW